MRILHVLDHSLPMHSGYTFRTRAIMTAQRAKGWQVRGVTGARHTAPPLDPASHATDHTDGLTFHRTPAVPSARSPIREWREIRALSATVGQIARAWKPDIIHAHSPVLDALAAAPIARRLGVPFVYEIRAFWEDAAVGNLTGREGDARYRLTRAIETRAAEGADGLAVICEGLRGDLIRRGVNPNKIVVVPNGVDMGLFGKPKGRNAPLAEAMGLKPEDEVIGFVGSFYPYEGLHLLIEAMPALVERRPRLSLLLVGGGPEDARLRALAEASPARSRIHFTGRVPHGDVDQLYGLVDVLVYPRRAMRLTELVTPLKPLEAMAEGKLVAASDVGGHRELIADGETGTLFRPDDAGAIVDAVAGLFENKSGWDKRRRTARRFVETERNWSSNIERYTPLYQQLVGKTA